MASSFSFKELCILEELQAEISRMSHSYQTVEDQCDGTRKRIESTLAPTVNSAIAENVEQLQLCLKLLTNLRMNMHLFDESPLQLRINQLRGLEKLAEFLGRLKHERLSAYLRQPTGSGKTVLFGVIARLLGVKTLVLVPRTNLVTQTVEEFRDVVGFSEGDIGRVMQGTQELGRTITIATYQSHIAKMMKNGAAYRAAVQDCELIVCDEAHRSLGKATAQSIKEADGTDDEEDLDMAGSDEHMTDEEERAEAEVLADLNRISRKALKLGFTATAELASKSVGEHFGECISEEKHSDMIAAGICVPYKLISVSGEVTDLDLDVQMTEEHEASILKREKVYEKLIESYADALTTYRTAKKTVGYPLRGIVFCVNIEECDTFSAEAKEHGLHPEIVTGREAKSKDSDDVIKAAEERLVKGEIDLIITVKKLAEGWNNKQVNAVIWARACNSPADVVQGIGRSARAYNDPIYGPKTESHIFETCWKIKGKNGKQRRKRPLGIADALLRNGEDPSLICSNANGTKLEYEKTVTRGEIEVAIKAHFTPETWAQMKTADKKTLTLARKKYGIAIATLFGVEGDPVGYHSVHLAIGRAVWGEHDVLKEQDDHKLKATIETDIRTRFTPETWAQMKTADKKTLTLAGKKYGIAIATLFGVEGDPTNIQSFHLAIGRAVWGDESM